MIYGLQSKILIPVLPQSKAWYTNARQTDNSLLIDRNPIQPDYIDNLQLKSTVGTLDTSPTFVEINQAINHLKKEKPGTDNMPPEVIKEGGYLLKCLLQLISHIWEEVVPQDMKDAVIVTVANCGNSRVISLISITDSECINYALTPSYSPYRGLLPDSQSLR